MGNLFSSNENKDNVICKAHQTKTESINVDILLKDKVVARKIYQLVEVLSGHVKENDFIDIGFKTNEEFYTARIKHLENEWIITDIFTVDPNETHVFSEDDTSSGSEADNNSDDQWINSTVYRTPPPQFPRTRSFEDFGNKKLPYLKRTYSNPLFNHFC